MRWSVSKHVFLLCLAVVAAAVLGGCSSMTTSPVTLKVHIVLFGGPPRPDGRMALSNAPEPDVSVTVANQAGRRWTVQTDQDGVATFSVHPGNYTLQSPACGPVSSRQIAVKADDRAYLAIRCDVR